MIKSASWVIVSNDAPEKALFETFDPRKVENLNKDKYTAIPIMDWLQSLNDQRIAKTIAYHSDETEKIMNEDAHYLAMEGKI